MKNTLFLSFLLIAAEQISAQIPHSREEIIKHRLKSVNNKSLDNGKVISGNEHHYDTLGNTITSIYYGYNYIKKSMNKSTYRFYYDKNELIKSFHYRSDTLADSTWFIHNQAEGKRIWENYSRNLHNGKISHHVQTFDSTNYSFLTYVNDTLDRAHYSIRYIIDSITEASSENLYFFYRNEKRKVSYDSTITIKRARHAETIIWESGILTGHFYRTFEDSILRYEKREAYNETGKFEYCQERWLDEKERETKTIYTYRKPKKQTVYYFEYKEFMSGDIRTEERLKLNKNHHLEEKTTRRFNEKNYPVESIVINDKGSIVMHEVWEYEYR